MPIADLETVGFCPICGSADATVEYAAVENNLFQNGPERWDYFRCPVCDGRYVNPRPTVERIGHFYDRLPQISEPPGNDLSMKPKSLLKRIKRGLLFGSLNSRYGYDLSPVLAWPLVSFANLIPGFVRMVGDWVCELPAPLEGKNRLLDIGCGPGQFMDRMRYLGWQVNGLELDHKTAELARRSGLNVYEGTVDHCVPPLPGDAFDAITMGDVIEHLHAPPADLRRIFGLLKPGGVLYVHTPNVGSLGYSIFGRCWFPLQPPRHLVMFTPENLRKMTESIGFHTLCIRESSRYDGFSKMSLECDRRTGELSFGKKLLGKAYSAKVIRRILGMFYVNRTWDGIVGVFQRPA